MDLVEAEREAVIAGLDAGVVDLAILIGERRYAGIRRATLWSERLLVALPAVHPLASGEHIELTDLRDETIFLSAEKPGSRFSDLVADCVRAAGIDPEIRVQHVSHESILNLLGVTGGVTFTCEGAAGATYPDVVLRELHGPQGQRWLGFSGHWRRENENPALRRFLAFVRRRYSLSFDTD